MNPEVRPPNKPQLRTSVSPLKGFKSGVFVILLLAIGNSVPAADKNGVSPNAISLPSGPGSIEGLGDSFQLQGKAAG